MPHIIEIKETIHGENKSEKLHYVTLYVLVQEFHLDLTNPWQQREFLKKVQLELQNKGYSLAVLTVEGKLRTRMPNWQLRIEPSFDRPDVFVCRFSSLQRPTSMDPSIPTMEDILFSRLFPTGI